jgi:hypothetical protein
MFCFFKLACRFLELDPIVPTSINRVSEQRDSDRQPDHADERGGAESEVRRSATCGISETFADSCDPAQERPLRQNQIDLDGLSRDARPAFLFLVPAQVDPQRTLEEVVQSEQTEAIRGTLARRRANDLDPDGDKR